MSDLPEWALPIFPNADAELIAAMEKLLAEAKDCFYHLDHCKGDCRSMKELDAGKGGGWPHDIKAASELLAKIKA